jgi:hypothetical protein
MKSTSSIGRWWSNLPVVGKVAVVLIPIVVVAAVLAVTLRGGGNGANDQAAALAAFCEDEQLLQTSFRINAMSQLASRLPADIQRFRDAGDAQDAAAVEQLLAAVQNMVKTLQARGDIGPANAKMGQAVDALPDCTSA